jgi:hypothetical protein
MTGYKLTKVVNDQLRAEGLKEIPAQMIYNYMRNGFISKENEVKQLEWLEKYITKRMAKKNEQVEV